MNVFVLAALSTLLGIGAAHAQTAPVAYGQITGVMRDSATAVVLVRGRACGTFPRPGGMSPAMRCSTTGDGGRYRIDSVPPGTFSITASCSGSTQNSSRDLATRTVVMTAGATVEWNLDVPATGCDQRPMERKRGRFLGLFYEPDFETSWFFPDGRTDQRAGADFTHTVRSPDALNSVKGTPYGHGCVRVTFAGTMHGPFNGTGYALDVDTVVAARQVPEDECFKVVEKFMPYIRSLHPRGGSR